MPERVVHYVDSTVFGGAEQVMLQLLRGLPRERWTPMLYCHDGADLARLVEPAGAAGVECRIVPAPRGIADVRAWRTFVRQLRADRPRLFHAHLGWPLSARHGILAARLASVPKVVATAHLYVDVGDVRWPRAKLWAQRSMVDRYIAVSREVATRFEQQLGVPAAKLTVVRNGIDVPPTLPTAPALRDELLAGSVGPLLLTIARLHPQKGHEHLLRAARELPEAIVALAGDGPERDRLQAMARELGIDARVRFLGHRTDVAALLAACDIFVLPSLYEGLPLSVLEAMAAGRPVVATRVGGTDEAIDEGVTGRLVPPADPGALAAALRELIDDRAALERLARAGRAAAERHFSVGAMVRGVEAIYDAELAAPAH